MNFDVLIEKFPRTTIFTEENSFEKINASSLDLVEILKFLKNDSEFGFDRLNTIIAVDLIEQNVIELIYDLHSTGTNRQARVSVLIDRNSANISSVVEVFKSAYFDECEIFDMFGINFDKNPNLKRLLMPKGWIGNPLRKDYQDKNEKLAWNNK